MRISSPNEAVENDLEVMRLLVEKGVSEPGKGFFFGLRRTLNLGLPIVPPALEYLCRQQNFFEFSLSHAIDFTVRDTNLVEFVSKTEPSSLLKTLSANGIDPMTIQADTAGPPLIAFVFYRYSHTIFDDPKEQQACFNSAVITFSLCLRHGFCPFAPKLIPDELSYTATWFALMDPDLTGVAWWLALWLNGWLTPNNDSKFGIMMRIATKILSKMDSPEAGNHGESIPDTTHYFEAGERNLQIPGAWVDENFSGVHRPKRRFVKRRFCSRPEDFTSTVRGQVWDESSYLMSEKPRFPPELSFLGY